MSISEIEHLVLLQALPTNSHIGDTTWQTQYTAIEYLSNNL